MPRTCTVCSHEQRKKIDTALLAGITLRTVADRWSVSKTSLIRPNGDRSTFRRPAAVSQESCPPIVHQGIRTPGDTCVFRKGKRPWKTSRASGNFYLRRSRPFLGPAGSLRKASGRTRVEAIAEAVVLLDRSRQSDTDETDVTTQC